MSKRKNIKYDFLIIGAGLFGAVCANILSNNGKKVLIVEKRKVIAGNCYTERNDDIDVHKYGAHIFHTDNEYVWEYMNKFTKFNNFINSPIAIYKNEVYSLPFNMYTFSKIFNMSKPIDVERKLYEQKSKVAKPNNLEEQAISLVGRDVYELLIKEYTEKQWGRKCNELPTGIITRLPVRYTYDNNYFNSKYQGIPVDGYTKMIENMICNCDLVLNADYLKNKEIYDSIADKIIYTGAIDEYFNFCYGELEYRTVRFEEVKYNQSNYQGNAVVNYTSHDVEYTRAIEHKWFTPERKTNNTIVSFEYSEKWKNGMERFYPINDAKNNLLYEKYKTLAENTNDIYFGGRLGLYKYYDMDKTIDEAIKLSNKLLGV